MKLTVVKEEPHTERVEQADDTPAIGSWWWVQDGKNAVEHYSDDENEQNDYERKKYDEPGRKWLAAVTTIGSNYAELKGVKLSERISLDDFHKRCTAEPDPDSYIRKRVDLYRGNVKQLMGEIQRVCALLGITPRQALQAGVDESSQALAIAHGTPNVEGHKKALVKAKEKTLPDLFKQVEAEHEKMATWMKAQLIPSKASLDLMKGSIGLVDKQIHTVELYAGLQEKLEKVRDGKPAPESEKVHLMQRRLYMDEECLVRYEAGGMNFEQIEDFDKWLARPENFSRILPQRRCIVAFRVRRYSKRYEGSNLADFISFVFASEADKWTFLYIRNGEQLWRMYTTIEFGSQLFPSKEDEDLLNDQEELWINKNEFKRSMLRTKSNVDSMRIYYQERVAAHEAAKKQHKLDLKQYKLDHAAWKAKGKELRAQAKSDPEWVGISGAAHTKVLDDHENHEPRRPSEPWGHINSDWKGYQKLTPDHLYYDDAMEQIKETAYEHNRIAVIVQGLLDRSPCLQPHPPWRIWTPEGFKLGIELVYDDTNVLTPGAAPDFKAYIAQLNTNLKAGCYTIGQHQLWRRKMAEAENARRSRRGSSRDDLEYFTPHGDPGPGTIAKITKIRGGKCVYEWQRESERATKTWVPDKKRSGWGHHEYDYKKIDTSFRCPTTDVMNVSAYTPGDFHLFYDDPRTRADYLKWAPFLLSAENWHARKRYEDSEAEDPNLPDLDLEPEEIEDEEPDDDGDDE